MNLAKTSKEIRWHEISRVLPIISQLRGYQLGWLRADILAAVTVWALTVPEAMAYASIAGVPLEAGLYTAPMALILYAIFATSRHLVVAPTTTVAIISASVIAPLAVGGSSEYIALTAGLAVITGVIMILAGVVRLGFITDFFAKPVLVGFVIGLGLVIGLGQLDKVLGLKAVGDNSFLVAWDLIRQLPDVHLLTAAVGLGCLFLILGIRRFSPKIPGALVALIASIAAVAIFNLDLRGVHIVGDIPAGLPPFSLPAIGIDKIGALVPGALAVLLVGYAESISTARVYAAKNGYKVDSNQEFIALGAANLGAGLSGGFVVDCSLSKTAAANELSPQTQVSNLLAGGLILVTILALTPLFHDLPEATLGAVVVAAISHVVDFGKLKRLYQLNKRELLFGLAALFGVLIFGLLVGLLIAILVSFASLVYRNARPGSAVLGREPGENVYQDISRHPEDETFPGLLIFRFDAELFFANSNYFHDELLRLIGVSETDVKAVLVDAESMHSLDITAAEMLEDLQNELSEAGVVVLMARVHGRVRDMMVRTGLAESIGPERLFPSVRAGVAYYLNSLVTANPGKKVDSPGKPAA